MTKPPRPRASRRLLWLLATLLVLSVATILVWRASTADAMASYRDFPNTYITEADCGYDPGKVVIQRGLTPDASIETPNGTAWEAYLHPDPTVVPERDGKPLIIPRITIGPGVFRTPPLPPGNQPLPAAEIRRMVKYHTPEGARLIERFRRTMAP